MKLSHILAAAVQITMLTACLDTTLPIEDCGDRPTNTGPISLEIKTDKQSYSLETDIEAKTTMKNNSSGPVYVHGEFALVQRQVNGVWNTIGPWFVADGICPTFAIQPSETLELASMRFIYISNQPGTYRFLYLLTRDPAGEEFVDDAIRTSPPFTVQE